MHYFIHNTAEFENILRFIFFIFGFLLFFFLGFFFGYRKKNEFNATRLINNFFLGISNVLFIKLIAPVSLTLIALKSEQLSYGFFNFIPTIFKYNSFNFIFIFTVSLIILDLVLYLQHVLTHIVPFLWKLHRVHHTDIGFDTTTSLRFHPFEILLSFFIKAFTIMIFGVSAEAVITFEIILNLSAMFNHSNFSLPKIVEKWISYFIVTPDMHRIHHSKISSETNSNYGFCLPIWDKMFKTYLKKSKDNPQEMDIGIETYRKMKDQKILKLLIQPFLK